MRLLGVGLMSWLREHPGAVGFSLVLLTMLALAAREIRWQIRERRDREKASRVYTRLARREVQR